MHIPNKKKEIDIGDYIISVQHLVQKSKGIVVSQKPIRRIKVDGDEEVKWRKERYLSTESPKTVTVNSLFGSVVDMFDFFLARNPEIREFMDLYWDSLERDDLNQLNQKVVPIIIDCIEKESKKVGVAGQKKFRDLKALFQAKFEAFQELLGQIMKAYSMPTFLYRNLNKYLRDEDWIALDTLLPFVSCLCIGIRDLQETANMHDLMKENSNDNQSMILYRGTKIHRDCLSMYSSEKFPYFSWYSVTSATTKLEIAERFMELDQKDGKFAVLFKIKVPVIEQDNDLYVNLKPFSKIPKEDEVILAPGSVFKLEKVIISQDPAKYSEIELTLETDTDKFARQGILMAGRMQSQASDPRLGFFENLKGDTVSNQLKYYSGNTLVETFKFKRCEFNQELPGKLKEVLSSTSNIKFLNFDSCSFQPQKENLKDMIQKSKIFSNIEQLQILENNDFCTKLLGLNCWSSLTSLSLDFPLQEGNMDKIIEKLCPTLQHLTQLTSLSLIFSYFAFIASDVQFTNRGVQVLSAEGLSKLGQLQSLSLSLRYFPQITDEGVKILFQEGLRNLGHLVSLELNFPDCMRITDEAISFIYSERLLCQLQSLSLGLRRCTGINCADFKDQPSQEVCQLKSLLLDLDHCWNVKYRSIDFFFFHCRINFRKLKFLEKLDLNLLNNLTEEDLSYLCLRGLQSLENLRDLNLKLNYCPKITDQGVGNLCSEGLRYLKKLKSLALKFDCCKITDIGVLVLRIEILENLSHLMDFDIKFFECQGITDHEIENFRCDLENHPNYNDSWKIRFLPKPNYRRDSQASNGSFADLIFLKWIFRRNIKKELVTEPDIDKISKDKTIRISLQTNPKITEEDVHNQISEKVRQEVLKNPTQLTNQHQNQFDGQVKNNEFDYLAIRIEDPICPFGYHQSEQAKIVEKVIHWVTLNELKKFSQVKTFEFFQGYSLIPDEGAGFLVSEGFKYFPEILCLDLNFEHCIDITNKFIETLVKEGLRNLPKLKWLKLNFFLSRVSKEGLENLVLNGIGKLEELTYLELIFKRSFEGIYTREDCPIQYLEYLGFELDPEEENNSFSEIPDDDFFD